MRSLRHAAEYNWIWQKSFGSYGKSYIMLCWINSLQTPILAIECSVGIICKAFLIYAIWKLRLWKWEILQRYSWWCTHMNMSAEIWQASLIIRLYSDSILLSIYFLEKTARMHFEKEISFLANFRTTKIKPENIEDIFNFVYFIEETLRRLSIIYNELWDKKHS
jgi:hypothetical protein